LPESSLKFVLG